MFIFYLNKRPKRFEQDAYRVVLHIFHNSLIIFIPHLNLPKLVLICLKKHSNAIAYIVSMHFLFNLSCLLWKFWPVMSKMDVLALDVFAPFWALSLQAANLWKWQFCHFRP